MIYWRLPVLVNRPVGGKVTEGGVWRVREVAKGGIEARRHVR